MALASCSLRAIELASRSRALAAELALDERLFRVVFANFYKDEGASRADFKPWQDEFARRLRAVTHW